MITQGRISSGLDMDCSFSWVRWAVAEAAADPLKFGADLVQRKCVLNCLADGEFRGNQFIVPRGNTD